MLRIFHAAELDLVASTVALLWFNTSIHASFDHVQLGIRTPFRRARIACIFSIPSRAVVARRRSFFVSYDQTATATVTVGVAVVEHGSWISAYSRGGPGALQRFAALHGSQQDVLLWKRA